MPNDPTYLGTVEDVQGATIRVVLDERTGSGLTFIRGRGYRIGQVGSFVRIPLGFTDLFGIVSQGYLSSKFGLKQVICCYLVFTTLLMLIFGFFKGSILVLILFGLIGFGIQGGFIGMYAVAAKLYPTQVRTTGVGWAIGLGRLGAVIGPIVGGLLIGMGLSMTTNFIIFAIPTIISGVAILFINND